MSNDQPNPNDSMPNYDLESRTAVFGEKIIDLCRKLPQDTVTRPLINQLVRAGTSVGANYCEADEASSKKDFINKISIAKKETKYWLRMIAHTLPDHAPESRILWKEAQELNLIFAAIVRNSRKSIIEEIGI